MEKLFSILIVSFLISICSAHRFQWRMDSIHGGLSDGQQGRELALNDFEGGTTSPWNDQSAADTRWSIEDYGSPVSGVAAPTPASGTKYLRVQRPSGTSGQATLHSDEFTVNPGDTVFFNFWIRSEILLVTIYYRK